MRADDLARYDRYNINRICNESHALAEWHIAMGDEQAARVSFQVVMYADALVDRLYGKSDPAFYRANRRKALDWFNDQLRGYSQ